MSGMEPTGPNLRGPCPSCGEALATDQRYCVTCGHRLGPALTLPYPGAGEGANRFGLPMPMRVASTLVISTLVFGVVVGTAMSTALSERVEPPAPHVAQAPLPPEPKQKAPSPAPPAPAPVPSVASTDDFTSPYAPGLSTPTTGPTKVKVPPQLIKGTVVQTNPVAGSYAVAQGGPLVSIHARSLPTVGSRVITPVRQLVNGTYAEDGKRKTKGQTDKATFTGVVTFRGDGAPDSNFYSVSSTGSSVLVSVTPDAAGKATLPPFGSSVTAEVRLEPLTAATPPPPPDPTTGAPPTTTTTPAPPPARLACDDGEELSPTVSQADKKLVQTKVDVTGETVTDGDLEGVVQAVCPGSRQIVLSADSTRDSKKDILLSVDRAIDLSRIPVGRAVEAGVSLASPSSLTVNGIASDQGMKAADSQKQVQGTL